MKTQRDWLSAQRWLFCLGQALAVRKYWPGGRSWFRWVALFLVGISLNVMMLACSNGSSTRVTSPAIGDSVIASKRELDLTLVSFAVTRPVYNAIIPKFQETWKQQHGQIVSIKQSYGGSGAQTRAVIDGLDADVVHLALALDTNKIVKAGLIEPGWEQEFPNDSIVSGSVAALIIRKGNPRNIKTWSDLTGGNVQLITADPKTSGVARWNFLALWNSVIKTGGDEAKATEFVTQVYKQVPVLTKDAREATDVFLKQGQGDVLINYENEILLAQQRGLLADYIIPDVNISIDNPIAIVDKNVDKHGNRAVAEAFVAYLFTPEAQEEFAKVGFRPIAPVREQLKAYLDRYPLVKTLGTVQNYGGWEQIQDKFFADGALFDQIQKAKGLP